MQKDNKMTRSLAQLDKLPSFLKVKARDFMLGTIIPYIKTSGLHFEKVSKEGFVVTIKNRKKTQNHIGQVHASAMMLIAETATGLAVGMNVPDDKLPLAKEMNVKYIRRTQGNMRAASFLSKEQREKILNEPKGEVIVPVKVTDETGEEVIKVEAIWAWVPKKKK